MDYLPAAYVQPGRAYHDLQYIREGVLIIKSLALPPRTQAKLIIAWWYHKAIHVPPVDSWTSTQLSATQCMVACNQLNIPQEQVVNLILATHYPSDQVSQAVVQVKEGKIMHDLTRLRLAANYDDFKIHRYALQTEYRPLYQSTVANPTHPLLALLSLPRIFLYDPFHTAHEQRARENIRTFLAAHYAIQQD